MRFNPDLALLGVAPMLGALQVFAFAPYDHLVLMPLTLAALFASWLWRPRLAPWTGFLFGVGLFLHGVSWVYISIHHIGQAPVPLAVALTVLFALFLGLFTALAGLLFRWGEARMFARVPLIVLAWGFTEWLRTWLFTGFPWLLSGYPVADSPLAGWAPVLGVLGLGIAVSLTAACMAWALMYARSFRGVAAAVGAPALIIAVGFVLQPIAWTHPVGEPIDVALVQGNTEQSGKWRPEQRTAIMADYRRLTLPHLGKRWIIWPETAIPVFLHQARDGFLEPLAREVANAGSTLMLGVPIYDRSTGRYYNGFVALGDDGAPRATYLKQHLVPFGEFVPLEWVIRPIMDMINIPMSSFSAGDRGQFFELDGVRVAVTICYEDIFPLESAVAARSSGLLVNVSNDGWFGRSTAAAQHHQMARLRALETGRPMLRVSTTGVTSLIDARGREALAAPVHRRSVLEVVVQPRAGETPFQLWGNLPLHALQVLTAAILIRRRRTRFS
ncbi:MAG: apolipoprotein N-acyltransferase [Gammaproteobacteria bacterium]